MDATRTRRRRKGELSHRGIRSSALPLMLTTGCGTSHTPRTHAVPPYERKLLSFIEGEHDSHTVTIVRDAWTGQFELLGDSSVATMVDYRSAGNTHAGRLEAATTSSRQARGILERFFAGAPLGSSS